MAKILVKSKLDVEIVFTINESEARALDALAGYGTEAFLKHFYATLGSAYMKPHEKGMIEFLDSIRNIVNPALGRLSKARMSLNNES